MSKNKFQKKRRSVKLWLPILVLLLVFAGANCSRNTSPEMERLAQGKPITNNIVNDEIQSYTVALEKGQYLGLEIEQHDVDTIAKVIAPNGEIVGEFDKPTSGRGTEIVRIGAETSGDYQIDVYTLSERAEPGEYTIKIAEFRPLTTRDQKVLAAVKLHQQADKFRAEPETRAESIPLYEKVLETWRELGEKSEEGNTLRAMGFAYQRMDNPAKAKENFGNALKIWEEIGDFRSAAFTHIIFGVIAKKQNDLEAGLQYDLSAQPLWEKAGDMPEYTQNLARIGGDYVKLQNKEEAFKYYEQALEKSRSLDGKFLQAYVLSSYGDAQAAFDNKNEALNYYRQSQDLWRTLNQDKLVENLQTKITKLQTK